MSCDIIIPIWNQLNYTRACIESVFRFTRFFFQLILIDNASQQPAAKYLERIKQKHPDCVSLIRNSENLGFVKAANQGLKASGADYACLLNNDTEVTAGWLQEMVKVAEAEQDIGIVNPNSNTFGLKVKRGQPLALLSEQLKSLSGQYSELAWASGFCMLIKRKVIGEIGLFDEIYGRGNFEDADFSKRAQTSGYASVCAKAAYVFHHERRSFIKFKQFDSDFNRNREIFHAKWGRQRRLLYILTRDNSPDKQKTENDILRSARKGDIVWVFLKNKRRRTVNPGMNTAIFYLSPRFFDLVSFWRVIKRKKKFDLIYVDNQRYADRLAKFKLFHRAEVVTKL